MIVTKWVLVHKLDELGIVARNKSILVAKGYNQDEGIDFDETFPPIARLKVISVLLAFASHMGVKLF